MPTRSRPLASAIAVIRSAMGRPPVLGSTLSPNFTGWVMVLLLVWRVRFVSASGDPAEGAGERVLLAGGERVQQELADCGSREPCCSPCRPVFTWTCN